MEASIKNPHFLLRRLHSLFGLVPVGAFLVFHIWKNSQSRMGAEHFNTHVVKEIKSMNYVIFFEIFLIALPILVHATYGLVIWYKARTNVHRFGFARNWMWWFQRLSGFAILAFLIAHVGLTRIYGLFVADDHLVNVNMYAYMQDMLSEPWMFAVYVAGLVLAAVHLCNGLFTAGISWGLTTTPRSQKIATVAWSGLCVLIIAMGIHSLLGFFMHEPGSHTVALEVVQ